MAVEFLELHGGYEMLAGLQAERLGLSQHRGAGMESSGSKLRARLARTRVVQEGERVTVFHGENTAGSLEGHT